MEIEKQGWNTGRKLNKEKEQERTKTKTKKKTEKNKKAVLA